MDVEGEPVRVQRILSGTVTDDDRGWYIERRVAAAGVIESSRLRRSDVGTRFFPSPIAYARARERTELEGISTAVLDERVICLAEAIANQMV